MLAETLNNTAGLISPEIGVMHSTSPPNNQEGPSTDQIQSDYYLPLVYFLGCLSSPCLASGAGTGGAARCAAVTPAQTRKPKCSPGQVWLRSDLSSIEEVLALGQRPRALNR